MPHAPGAWINGETPGDVGACVYRGAAAPASSLELFNRTNLPSGELCALVCMYAHELQGMFREVKSEVE